jgi:ribosomal protein L11 methyltransferase
MYSLHVTCLPEEVDLLSGELWEAGTLGIREVEQGARVTLIAGFGTNEQHAGLLKKLAAFAPKWQHEESIDWIEETYRAWPAREIGERLFLAPPWSKEPTPAGRERVVHNPGLACGTGEHPCTQLALIALEKCVKPACKVADIGTGSGILAIAAAKLGAAVVGLDLDEAALRAARENFLLNDLVAPVAAGSAECLADACADVTVANISGTVLLAIADELSRVTAPNGWLILTGFTEPELRAMQQSFSDGEVSALNEWRCLSVWLS